MKKIWEGPLSEVESAIADNYETLTFGVSDIIEQEVDYMIVARPYEVKVAELHVYCKEGTYYLQDVADGGYEPDFDLILVYGFDGEDNYLYWEQDGIAVTLANFFHGTYTIDQINAMHCELLAEGDE